MPSRNVTLYFREESRNWLKEIRDKLDAGEEVFVHHQSGERARKRRAKVVYVNLFAEPDELKHVGAMRLDLNRGGRGWPEEQGDG